MSDALKQIWEKVDQMIGPQRMETEAEHIARDMREGRFPKRSDPIQVPVAGPAAARHLAPGDDLGLIERLQARDKSRHGYYGHPLYNRDGPEAAARIAALTAERDEARTLADDMEQEAHAHIALWGDAMRENATLRDRLARMDGALEMASIGLSWAQEHLRDTGKMSITVDAAALVVAEARAALTDGGSNG